eukprot:TCONS_00042894-protein
MASKLVNSWFDECVSFNENKYVLLNKLKESFRHFHFPFGEEVDNDCLENEIKRIFMEKGVKFSSKIFRKHGKKFLKVFRVELRRDLSIAHKVSVIKTVGTCQDLSMSHEGMNAESVADEETMSNWDNDCLPLE